MTLPSGPNVHRSQPRTSIRFPSTVVPLMVHSDTPGPRRRSDRHRRSEHRECPQSARPARGAPRPLPAKRRPHWSGPRGESNTQSSAKCAMVASRSCLLNRRAPAGASRRCLRWPSSLHYPARPREPPCISGAQAGSTPIEGARAPGRGRRAKVTATADGLLTSRQDGPTGTLLLGAPGARRRLLLPVAAPHAGSPVSRIVVTGSCKEPMRFSSPTTTARSLARRT